MKKKIFDAILCLLGICTTTWAQDTIITTQTDSTKFAIEKNIITTAIDSTDTIQQVNNNDTIELKIIDVIANYGITKEFFEDSNAFENTLASLPKNYANLRDFCRAIADNVRSMIANLDLDYRDGIVWIDERSCITDYESGRVVLHRLMDIANQKEIEYNALEEERIEYERKLAEERAKEEARRKQEAKNNKLAELHQNIATNHHTIDNICNKEVANKYQQKTLKDLYYAYLAVYNKYDITTAIADDRLINENSALANFQQHFIDSVLSDKSYIQQLNNFKDELKTVSGRNYSNVFKSYSKLFKRTSIAINFSTVEEYNTYIEALQEIRATQKLYLESVKQLTLIDSNSANITKTYGKKYREEANAYHTMVENIDFTPTFVTSELGGKYIDDLKEFQQVQQYYLDNYTRLENIDNHSKKIIEKSGKHFSDIENAYNNLLDKTSFVTSFNTLSEAQEFTETLNNFEQIQDLYDQVIYIRIAIRTNDDSIQHLKYINKYLTNSYKSIKKTCKLTPDFISVEMGEAFIKVLKEHIGLQNLYITTLFENKQIQENTDKIYSLSKPYKYISKTYKRIAKTYAINKDIVSTQDLEVAIQLQRQHLEMQQIFMKTLQSANVGSINKKMKQVSDLSEIKLILGME